MSGRVRGWCPSAHHPMHSGDGLLVRVKPRLGRLSAADLPIVCHLAARLGNGVIDLTSRANLQLRGVSEADYPALLTVLIDAGLVDPDPAREAKRMIVANPNWSPGDLLDRMASSLDARLDELPDLPGKMGITFNFGPVLAEDIIGDFRFESSGDGMILRADGATQGRPFSEDDAVDRLIELARWFVETGGRESGRMSRHLTHTALPREWLTTPPNPTRGTAPLGAHNNTLTLGVPFGATDATALSALLDKARATHLRITPWRSLVLENAHPSTQPGFLTQPDPVLTASACPGAPACAQSSVETRDIARLLAPRIKGTIHVSGCDKGCARRLPADVTLVGRNGKYDLVQGGRPGDTADHTALNRDAILGMFA